MSEQRFEPTIVRVHGYKPHRGQRQPSAVIHIEGEIPDDLPVPGEYQPDWQTRLAEKFGEDAQSILDALAHNLPGGTMHQLLIKMLQREVCLHVVQDVPDTTIRDIAELARAFVWKYAALGPLPLPEWLLLCQAVKRRFGEPPEATGVKTEG